MEDGYPDPDEEFELMYADDLELMREAEERDEGNVVRNKPLPAKRSLDFSSPVTKTCNYKNVLNTDQIRFTQSVQPLEELRAPNNTNTSQIGFTQSVQSLEELHAPNNTNTSQIGFTQSVQSLEELHAPNNRNTCQIGFTQSVQPLEELHAPNNTNKRTIEDLFGDIEDICYDDIVSVSKKPKTEEETDLELINSILECRKLRSMLESSNPSQKTLTTYEPKQNLSLNVPKWPFLPLTNSNGDRIYVKYESEETWEKSLDKAIEQPSLNCSNAVTWCQARKYLEDKQKAESEVAEDTQVLPEVDVNSNNTNLWVEKYKPKSYFDLLSEESVNRTLLQWLHLWDKIVFKKEVKTQEPQQRNTFSKRTGQFQLTGAARRGAPGAGAGTSAAPELDADGRPHHKVALLCGPPGAGKTTLAHLLAKLAGYRPVEVNASDERSVEAFRGALHNATLMRPLLDADRRPNCLILDEIDGAPLASVELLVKWCTAGAGAGAGAGGAGAAEGGKRKGKTQPLRRPVIAICNDLYANSLRPLRAVSLIVRVGGVGAARLGARLARLAAAERLQLAPRVAAALAARARGDVRAAIQVLSFLKGKAKTQVTMEDVENAAIGTKDCGKSLMEALRAVFTIDDRTDLLRTIYSAGDYDRLAEGIFENYLSARVDARLRAACGALAWLRLHDAVGAWTARRQDYSLYGALPLCLAACHAALATRAPPALKYPLQAQEVSRRRAELASVVWAVWRGSCPAVSRSRTVLLLDVLPLLPYVLAPALRVANVQLCSEAELAALRACARAQLEHGLQYVQQRGADGLYAHVLEPDVNKVAFFGNEDRLRPTPAVRQAISREQQLEVIRRSEEMANRVISRTGQRKTTIAKPSESGDTATTAAPLPNHMQRLKPVEIEKPAPQVHRDFFGRIVPVTKMQRSGAVADSVSSGVFYQYREGFNNAVRRNVRTRDLL